MGTQEGKAVLGQGQDLRQGHGRDLHLVGEEETRRMQ